MTPRQTPAALLLAALIVAAAGCDRKDTTHLGAPADTPATGTTSSTNPGTATPPASAASN